MLSPPPQSFIQKSYFCFFLSCGETVHKKNTRAARKIDAIPIIEAYKPISPDTVLDKKNCLVDESFTFKKHILEQERQNQHKDIS